MYSSLSDGSLSADEAAMRANTQAQGAKRRTNLADPGMPYRSLTHCFRDRLRRTSILLGNEHLVILVLFSGQFLDALQSSIKMGTGVHGANGEREDDGEPGAPFPTIRGVDSPAMPAHDSFDERQP